VFKINKVFPPSEPRVVEVVVYEGGKSRYNSSQIRIKSVDRYTEIKRTCYDGIKRRQTEKPVN
jgi:hypothetical protein